MSIDAPAARVGQPPDDGLVPMLRRRVDGTFLVDEWGLDQDVVSLIAPALALRWRVTVEGGEQVPASGPAVVVHNRRLGLSEPFVVALAVRIATGRPARPVGAPDIAPLGTALRRLGGVVGQAGEVAALLRADQVVAVPLGRELWSMHGAGRADARLLAPAFDQEVPVVPVAVFGHEAGRRWRVRFGPPVGRTRRRGGTASAGADAVAEHIRTLLA